MPKIFDFNCSSCGKTYEKLLMDSEHTSEKCPHCQSQGQQFKKVSAPARFYGLDFETPRSSTGAYK